MRQFLQAKSSQKISLTLTQNAMIANTGAAIRLSQMESEHT